MIDPRLIREQLETTMDKLSCMREVQRPAKGWLRAVREALGMTGKQFARRLGVSAPRVTVLEKDELSGGVTLNSMRQAIQDSHVTYEHVFGHTLGEWCESALVRSHEQVPRKTE